MDKKGIFEERAAAYEAQYFVKKEAETVEKLKAVFRKKVDRDAIRAATGVTDERMLDRMVELNLKGELMAAFQIYPLVEIAWADGRLEMDEVTAVLAAAAKHGIAEGTNAHHYLEERLKAGVSEDLRKVWFLYAGELKKTLSPDELNAFRTDILDLCRGVAEASGGLLGKRFAVSRDEKKVLEKVEAALTP